MVSNFLTHFESSFDSSVDFIVYFILPSFTEDAKYSEADCINIRNNWNFAGIPI